MAASKRQVVVSVLAASVLLGGSVAAFSQGRSPQASGDAGGGKPSATATPTPTPTKEPTPDPEVSGSQDPMDPKNVRVTVSNASAYDKATPTLKVEPAAPGLRWDDAAGAVVGLAAPSTKYSVTMSYAGESLKPFTFTTAEAPKVKASINFTDGTTYGVGMPVRVEFKKPVKDRAAVERASQVASTPAQSGSWGWLSDKLMVWRPDRYWRPGTKVDVTLNHGAVLVDDKHFGTDRKASFNVGRSLIMRIDDRTHHAEIIKDGSVVKKMPVSLGKATRTHRTRSGVKIIFTRQRNYTMVGPPNDPYRITVAHAMRLTFSGEFAHSAPWSVGAQGRRNVSHGCTNLSPSNAAWLYENSLVGDVVETEHTGRPVTHLGNGWGAVWNATPEKWRTYSMLSPDSRHAKKKTKQAKKA